MRRPCRTPPHRPGPSQPGTSVSFFDVPSYISLRLAELLASYTCHHSSYLNVPESGRGQTRNTIFPTICSLETQPTVVLRESTEVERWWFLAGHFPPSEQSVAPAAHSGSNAATLYPSSSASKSVSQDAKTNKGRRSFPPAPDSYSAARR